MAAPGLDHPHRDGEVEVVLLGHPVSVSARVEAADAATVVLRASVGEFSGQQVVRVGEEVQLVWHDAPGVRMVTAEVATVQRGAVPRWHLDVTAPAEPVQRREAVRGRFGLPLTVTVDGADLRGDVLDLSETGIRAAVDACGPPPSPGATVAVVLQLEDDALTTRPRWSGAGCGVVAGRCPCASPPCRRRSRTGCAAACSGRCARTGPA